MRQGTHSDLKGPNNAQEAPRVSNGTKTLMDSPGLKVSIASKLPPKAKRSQASGQSAKARQSRASAGKSSQPRPIQSNASQVSASSNPVQSSPSIHHSFIISQSSSIISHHPSSIIRSSSVFLFWACLVWSWRVGPCPAGLAVWSVCPALCVLAVLVTRALLP